MKKLFTIALVLLGVACTAQEKTIMDYTTETAPVDGDYLYLIKGGTADRNVSKGIFQQNIQDSLVDHLGRIEGLEAGGGSFWDKTGNDLSPSTPGDHILLSSSDQALKFRDGTTQIYAATPGQSMFFEVNGNEVLSLHDDNTVVSGDLEPKVTSTQDIGRATTPLWWRSLYVDQIYLDDVANNIDISGSDIALTSAAAGTKTLSELDGQKEVSYTNCPDNTTTNITLDSDGVSFRIHYVSERNMGAGVRKQSGTIDLLYDDVTDITYYSSDYVGVDLDFAIEASDATGTIRLDIVVGNANTNDLSFAYNVISKLYE